MSNAPNPGWPPPAVPRPSTTWQVLQSWWLLLPVLGCSCLGGLGFIYVGLRAQRAAWWLPGIFYTVVGSAAFLVVGESDQESALSDWAVGVLLAVWIASILHAALINPAWLRWLTDRRARFAATAWPGGAYPLAPLPGAAPAGPIPHPYPGMSPTYQPGSTAGYPSPAYPPGYPPASPAYPPGSPAYPQGSSSYPPESSYPPASSSYPPGSPSYPPASSAYPPGSPVYPPASTTGHPPTSTGYPPLAADPTLAPAVDPFPTGPITSLPWQPDAPAPGQPDAPASGPPAGPPVDVNAAGPGDLAALPGFDPQRARQVLAERERRGSFGSLAEFAAAANLAPHEYARLRDAVECVPPAGPAPDRPPPGRVLDV
ncbi:helix-hairpin-helix domain-containing protein [Micromonospora sp. NPDC007220]|uniref:helix-hairpin-helix domain-containing protein n=1 Tax=Micromonospora sp. NPDC007220 TaxID=3154318 RepID=UPI0033D9DE33